MWFPRYMYNDMVLLSTVVFVAIQELAHSLNAYKKWQLIEICDILMTRQL